MNNFYSAIQGKSLPNRALSLRRARMPREKIHGFRAGSGNESAYGTAYCIYSKQNTTVIIYTFQAQEHFSKLSAYEQRQVRRLEVDVVFADRNASGRSTSTRSGPDEIRNPGRGGRVKLEI
jgi:hypothetical protein